MLMRVTSLRRLAATLLVALATLLFVAPSFAEPRATLLRIDPRASLVDGAPVLTTVIDLVQHKSLSDVTSRCATLSGNDHFRCVANGLEKPQALYDTFKFPEDDPVETGRQPLQPQPSRPLRAPERADHPPQGRARLPRRV